MWERVRRECAFGRRRTRSGRSAAPRSGSRTRGRVEPGHRRREPAGTRARNPLPTPSPLPPLALLRPGEPPGPTPPPAGHCPAAPLDVPSALAGPPPALAASVGPVLRPPGVEREGSRGLRLPVLPRSPPVSPGPPVPRPQLPGLGGRDNGL